MNAQTYYNEKKTLPEWCTKRSEIRHTHNFLKAYWMSTHIHENATILDLGCGHGGDFHKISYLKPQMYIGIDFAKEALATARTRISCFSKNMKLVLVQSDFVHYPQTFECHGSVDCVLSNLAFHYAFENAEITKMCLQSVYNTLSKNGYFLGVIPISDKCIGSTHTYRQPNDGRMHTEPCGNQVEFIEICRKSNLSLISWVSFEDLYDEASKKNPKLTQKMKAEHEPQKNAYAAFAFQKII
jgi:SAM-dependent methyltransferase